MRSLIINLSPRPEGTSAMLCGRCNDYLKERGGAPEVLRLYAHLDKEADIMKAVAEADTVVMIGPSYINTFPADTFWLLERLHANKTIQRGQRIYGVIQGGMPYAHTHRSGLTSLKLFCDRCDFVYGGGFVMGLGAMLDGQPLSKMPGGKRTAKYLDQFFQHIADGEASPDQLYEKAQLRLPGFIARILAKRMNESIDEDLRAHGIDPQQPSLYLDSP